MLVDYEVLAIGRYKDKTPKPYYMDRQLEEVKVDTFLLVGDKDLLFPFQKIYGKCQKTYKEIERSKSL